MLSAIAVRKAAEAALARPAAAQPNIPQVEHATEIPRLSDEAESDTTELQNILRLRKRKWPPGIAEALGQADRRRRKKARRAEARTRRYFQRDIDADEFKDQDDVIVVDSKVEDEDTDEGEGLEVIDLAQDDSPGGNISEGVRRRAWTPSQPFQELSDEDSLGGDLIASGEDPSTPRPSRWQPPETPSLITTYVPRLDENLFYFDHVDVKKIVGPQSEAQHGSKSTILVLTPEETVVLIGTCTLTILRGSVSLSGVTLSPSPISHCVFAPQCAPLPVLHASNPPSSPAIDDDAWHAKLPEHVDRLLNTSSTVVLLQELRTGVEGLGKVCRTFDHVFDYAGEHDFLNIQSAHIITRHAPHIQLFHLSSSWSSALSSLPCFDMHTDTDGTNYDTLSSQTLIALVKGPKRTGKSTFARTLLNRLTTVYRRVAFLECDLGQTEFTPPGMVALSVIERPIFGPPFCHPAIPLQAHFIGSITPRSSPTNYLTAIECLLQTYRLELQYSESDVLQNSSEGVDNRIDGIVPLVINTMGWIKGLGADLSHRIEDMVEPTHVFSLHALDFSEHGFKPETPQRHVPLHQHSMGEKSVEVGTGPVTFDLDPVSEGPLTSRYTAADWRTISLLSYFHSRPSLPRNLFTLTGEHSRGVSSPDCTTWNTALPLLAHSPYVVMPKTAFDNVVLLGSGSEDVVGSEIGRVLNGAIVALVRCAPGTVDNMFGRAMEEPHAVPYYQGSPPPDPQMSTCLGLALIRACSPSLISSAPTHRSSEQHNQDMHLLHILTPLPPLLLASTRVMVKGEIELPVWGMLDFRDAESGRGKDRDSVPYLQWGRGEGVGAERRRIRRNLMRRAQM